MLTAYLEQAMRQAHYEIMENGRCRGEIPPLVGVRREHQIPVIAGRMR